MACEAQADHSCATGDNTSDTAGALGGIAAAGGSVAVIPAGDRAPTGRGCRSPPGHRALATDELARGDEGVPVGGHNGVVR